MSDRVGPMATLGLAVVLALAVALSALAAANDTLPGDTAVTSWLQDRWFPGRALSEGIRYVTSAEPLLAAGSVLAIGLWLRGYRRQALVFAAGLIILPLLQAGIKEIVDRARPSEALVDVRADSGSPSFPSGHVMSPTYVYGYLLYVVLTSSVSRAARAVTTAAGAAVLLLAAPANVWLGVHWPSDVIGGYLWGAVLLLPALILGRFGSGGRLSRVP